MIAREETGAGRAALFSHGLTEHRRLWDTDIPLLEAKPKHVVGRERPASTRFERHAAAPTRRCGEDALRG